MARDSITDALNKMLLQKVNELIKSGMSEKEIAEHIDNDDIELDKALSKMIDADSQQKLQYLKSHIFEISAERRASASVFIARQEEKWGKCFAASDAMYILATEAGELYGRYVEENVDAERKESSKYTFLALQHLHGRACQEFLEILYLMKLGFADGAYARWRSMYELSCIGSFIRKQGEQIARQYWEQSETEEPSYAWAKGARDQNGKELKRWTFRDIQDACDVQKVWTKQYQLACFVNHASPQGTFKRLANGKTLGVIPVGHSDYGITTPAEHSAISLAWITNLFLTIFPYGDGIVNCNVLNAWVDIIRDQYFSAHDEIFKDLEKEV